MPHRPRTRIYCVRLVVAAIVLSPLAAHAQDPAGEHPGKQIFTTESQPACGICHALADAGAAGEIGPNLDDLKPTEDQVRAAVRDGVGVMPAYAETLSEEQIAAVSEYVAKAVGQPE